MKHFGKILTLGAAIAAAPLAYATPISGTIVTVASVTVGNSASNTNVIFANPGSVATAAQGNAPTGTLAPLAGDAVTFNNFNYANLTTPFLLYSGTDATIGAFSFTITTGTCSATSSAFPMYFNCSGVGTMAENGYTSTSANFIIGVNQSGNLNFSETNAAIPTVTPEPSSLVMLGTGLMSAAGMVLRRRRAV